MFFLFFVFGLPLALVESEGYVLLQVRKQDADHSNVDAHIHKVVPSSKFDKFIARINQMTAKEQAPNARPINKATETEEVFPDGLAIPDQREKEPSVTDILNMLGRKFANGPSGPMFRSKSEGYLFKPETVHLRSGQSSLYSVDPDNLIVALKELLSSVTLKKYLEKLTRKAAVVYRTVENDLQPITANLFSYTM